MPHLFIDPPELPQVDLYHQVSVAAPGRLVHVAGQVAVDAHGQVVGEDDLAAQTEQCYLNLAAALAAAGATFDDVVKVTVYLVDWTPGKLASYLDGVNRAAERLGSDSLLQAPLTGIGVAALANPSLLVEVEVVAVVE
ncbi:RidA family protein [Nocardioides dongkuii]|uniref:RidA family protein n=1 Tax=Nocardioides dongkuii TaxID=2760089 RepID=UPI0015FBC644|nr:RidA family protein [Nocardioides dongkuii]